ncbi:MAG: glycosyltransferase family 4 protein [Deltaproteobacteria bacterium]|nr:glycosyltransferase family 4 protein [Deltaproteobacteria bacterium]
MRIAIDARMINYTGIGRYTQNLIASLARLDVVDLTVLRDDEPPQGAGIGRRVKFRKPTFSIPVYSMKEHILLPLEMKMTGADLFHYPSFNMPLVNPRPSVVTIHDLVYYLDQAACPGKMAHLYARLVFRKVAGAAKRILTLSEYTKKDIVEHLGVHHDKVVVTYPGVDEFYRPERESASLDRVRKRYSIDGDYVLYVGNHGVNKNLHRLLNAFAGLKNRKSTVLILAGKTDPRRQDLYNLPSSLGVEDRVRFIGKVPEEDLPALYTMAKVFVFPSLYEGFGLPPLEAMACGAPVVASTATSLPEAVGDAGVLADPFDAGAIAGALDKVLSSKALQSELREKGIKRAGRFSWLECAKKTVEVYREALQ